MLRVLGIMLLMQIHWQNWAVLGDAIEYTDLPANVLTDVQLAKLDSSASNDKHKDCEHFKSLGYCDPNHEYYSFMADNCVRTCGIADCPDFPGKVVVSQTGSKVVRPEGSTTLECIFDISSGILNTLDWNVLTFDGEDLGIAYNYSLNSGEYEIADKFSHIVSSPEAPKINHDAGAATIKVQENVKDLYRFKCVVSLYSFQYCSAQVTSQFEDLPVSLMLNGVEVYQNSQDKEFCSLNKVPNWYTDYSAIECQTRYASGKVSMQVSYQMLYKNLPIGTSDNEHCEMHDGFNCDVTLAAQILKSHTELACQVNDTRGTTLVRCQLPGSIAGCTQYDSAGDCTLCSPGFHVSDDAQSCTGCMVSMDGCVTCTSAKTCTSCRHGYAVTADGSSCEPKDVKYEHYFPEGSLSKGSIQCMSWEEFRKQLTHTSYTSVRMYGTYNEAGLRCSDVRVVNKIASALRTGGSSTSTFQCEGRTWRTGTCGTGVTEIAIDAAHCSCASGNTGLIRPCQGGTAWGGVNTATCPGPSQTMGIEFSIA